MKPAKIRLPSPKALRGALAGADDKIKRQLEVLAQRQMSELEQLASLCVPDLVADGVVAETLGVEKFDMYDAYFEVERTSKNPADELAGAFISSLVEIGEEAKRGHNLDPLALNSFLRAVQVQARVLLMEAYHE